MFNDLATSTWSLADGGFAAKSAFVAAFGDLQAAAVVLPFRNLATSTLVVTFSSPVAHAWVFAYLSLAASCGFAVNVQFAASVLALVDVLDAFLAFVWFSHFCASTCTTTGQYAFSCLAAATFCLFFADVQTTTMTLGFVGLDNVSIAGLRFCCFCATARSHAQVHSTASGFIHFFHSLLAISAFVLSFEGLSATAWSFADGVPCASTFVDGFDGTTASTFGLLLCDGR